MHAQPEVRFAAIGLNHDHVYGQTNLLLRNGARLVAYHEPEARLAGPYASAYPQARQVRSAEEILEDPDIQLVISAAVPCERAVLGIRVMQHGKDYMSDKPGFTTIGQLAEAQRVQSETQRIYSICFSERFEVPAAVKAGELVQAGAIGRAVQTTGLGPHRIHPPDRPAWFYERAKYGGILTDIGSHQADQFLFFTGSTEAAVVASQTGNFANPEHPELEDFGDMLLRGNGGTGYVRVDWYTPQGLGVWGDARLTILGTEGYIGLRKYIDIAGRSGADHLFLVDRKGIHYIDCKDVPLPYGRQLIHDIVHRTESSMTQAHCFLASQLALQAEAGATRLGNLR